MKILLGLGLSTEKKNLWFSVIISGLDGIEILKLGFVRKKNQKVFIK
jgi:hypothetical protein